MAITSYGALRGRFELAKREGGGTPHLQIKVLAGATPWRIAVNVQSQDTSHVVYWIVDPVANHPILNAIAGLAVGFNDHIAPDAAHALDVVKAPLFNVAAGRTLPPTGNASADDLQDLLLLHLTQLKTAGGELVAFGARFTEDRDLPIDDEFGNPSGLNGIHDIHLNQGNPLNGGHAGDNGPFHDGGLLLVFPTRVVGLFLAFQSQRVPTDQKGNPAANSRSLKDLIAPDDDTPPPPPPGTGLTVYLERALINPAGNDVGLETVVLGNLTTAPQNLAGWKLKDTTGRTSPLDGTIAAGASLIVPLDGTGVQLRNKRGNLLLLDDHDNQIDAVTYSSEDANKEGRYVRF